MESEQKQLMKELSKIRHILENLDGNLSDLNQILKLKGGSQDIKSDGDEDRVLSVKETSKILGISRSTLYVINKKPDFPSAINLTDRRTGYLHSEIMQYISLIRGKG